MKVRFLGAHNTETNTAGLMCLLVDEVVALDAGSLTSRLPLSAQLALKAVLITHPHYDHIRDLPMLAMNCYLNSRKVHIYGSQAVKDTLSEHIMNGNIYSNFFARPVMDFHIIEPGVPFSVADYDILPVSVNHSVPSNGYQVTSKGHSFFYTGDTGPGLENCWQHISPQLLIIDVTSSNRFTNFGRDSKHLTPELLKGELSIFRSIRGYIPRVVAVHMNPALEAEIAIELKEVATGLGCSISLAGEGLELEC